jgi:hypothetical protein
MTCFWDGILQSLDNDDFRKVGISKLQIKPFIQFLKSKNTKNITTTWNGEKLTSKQCEENYQHIANYNIDSIYGGYDCSGCDPFLILVTQIFSLNTIHNYMGHKISYMSDGNVCKNVNYGSNRGHFYFISCKKLCSIQEQSEQSAEQSPVTSTVQSATTPVIIPYVQNIVSQNSIHAKIRRPINSIHINRQFAKQNIFTRPVSRHIQRLLKTR